MDEERKQTLSEERAEAYAPAPTGGLAMAAVCGGGVALFGDFVVSGFYGWDVGDHLLIAAGLIVAGSAIAWVGYKRLARANRIAVRVERVALDAQSPDHRT